MIFVVGTFALLATFHVATSVFGLEFRLALRDSPRVEPRKCGAKSRRVGSGARFTAFHAATDELYHVSRGAPPYL